MNKSESKYFNTGIRFSKALISLLEKKPFEYITVSEVCREAGTNRSTFYLHYENTSDLLRECTRYVLDGFIAYFSIDERSITDRFSACPLDELNFIRNEYLIPYLTYVKDNRRVFEAFLSHKTTFGTEDIFKRMLENIFVPILDRFGYPCEVRRYVMIFYLSGITAIITEWLRNGCKDSAEDVSEIIRQCIFGRNGMLFSE